MQCPPHLETISLIEYAASCNGCKWQDRKDKAIVQFFPWFYIIPKEDSEYFEIFCWSDLLLYKIFRQIDNDIGLTKEDIINNWKHMNT